MRGVGEELGTDEGGELLISVVLAVHSELVLTRCHLLQTPVDDGLQEAVVFADLEGIGQRQGGCFRLMDNVGV